MKIDPKTITDAMLASGEPYAWEVGPKGRWLFGRTAERSGLKTIVMYAFPFVGVMTFSCALPSGWADVGPLERRWMCAQALRKCLRLRRREIRIRGRTGLDGP